MRAPAGTFQRFAGICGLLAFVTVNIGWIVGGFAQPAHYSSAQDDISDLGALTAAHSWFYNQIGANLTGVLVILVAVALWRALPGVGGRIGAAAFVAIGIGAFLDGMLRLDCRGIDSACANTSWHAHAHKVESGFTAAVTLIAPVTLALAFRRRPEWRNAWWPTAAVVPALVAASALFSLWGDGAATRAATDVAFLWIAFVGFRLLRAPEVEQLPRRQRSGAGVEPTEPWVTRPQRF